MPQHVSVDSDALRKQAANLLDQFDNLRSVNQRFSWAPGSVKSAFESQGAADAYGHASVTMADMIDGLYSAGIRHADNLNKVGVTYAAAEQGSYDIARRLPASTDFET